MIASGKERYRASTMIDMKFNSKLPWAIVPTATKYDAARAKEQEQLLSQHFRWVRRSRAAELCWPWRLSQDIGWTVRSPVDVRLCPIHDQEIAVREEDSAELSNVLGP